MRRCGRFADGESWKIIINKTVILEGSDVWLTIANFFAGEIKKNVKFITLLTFAHYAYDKSDTYKFMYVAMGLLALWGGWQC